MTCAYSRNTVQTSVSLLLVVPISKYLLKQERKKKKFSTDKEQKSNTSIDDEGYQ